jgi:hypothetical protein
MHEGPTSRLASGIGHWDELLGSDRGSAGTTSSHAPAICREDPGVSRITA